MSSASFRKTLLALAVTGAALPVYAQSLELTNAGLYITDKIYSETVEITGSFTSENSEYEVVEIDSTTFEKDLIFNSTVNASGSHIQALDLTNGFSSTEILGSLINKGSIAVNGGGSVAILIDPAVIHGDLINEGTLSAKGGTQGGEGIRALEFSGQSELHGDLINAASGKIMAEGGNATGILLMGGEIDGKLVNHGLIQVSGVEATAIDATSNEFGTWSNRVDLGGVENHGSIIAQGEDAVGLMLDGVSFASSAAQVINTGSIQADDAAIQIGSFDIKGGDDRYPLRIRNSGTIISQDEAIDASEASGPVYLSWDAGTITGNLIDLSNIEINGNVTFNGTDASADGANIRMKDNSWIDVGSTSDQIVGHLELGQTHTSIDGNLYVSGNSSLGMSLSSATDANKAILDVSGTAEFSKGAQIKLAAKGSDFSAKGSDYKLITAGSIENNGLSVVSSSSLLKVDTYAVQGNEIIAKVTGKSVGEMSTAIAQSGGSRNAQAAGATFSQLVLNQLALSNPSDPVRLAFIAASENPAALAKLSEQLAPQVNGGSTSAAVSGQNLVSNVTGNRTSSVRQGLSSGDALTETGVWVQALYSDANQDLRDGIAGYNAYSRGIAVGADGKLNDQLTLGLAYSFLNTDVNSNTGNDTEVEGHAFTLYSGYELGNYFLDGSLTYGVNDNSSERHIATTKAKGDYDSNLLGVNLVGGYSYHLSNELLIEPRLAARYSQVEIDGYREKGSSAALKVEGQRYEVGELGAGIRLAGSFAVGQGTLEPQAKLMAYHDFIADQAASTSTFVLGGTPFTTFGAKPARNSYEAGVGLDYHLGAVTLGASYDYVGKSDFDADTFTAKVRYDF
ncbi:autotransporter family protein [Pseudomonas paeninsulae]|uniref:autotransporter family protein n=1 Tax=Pseudomonas paeninsulae TaxID=3110772 RepID=UPI002D781176|nr:autotransporter domain-containing protein [Pseudomonas sp. IT1137]